MNKLNNFQSFVLSKSINCFCVCETWLSDIVNDNEILPSNYAVYRCDREARGGGVLVAVEGCIPSRQLLTTCPELVLVELDLHPKIYICCIYVPPACSEDLFTEMLHSLQSVPTDGALILAGDFNAPDINWNTLTANSSRSSSLCDLFFSMNLVNLVTGPTHRLGSILDLVLSNSPEIISNLTIDSSAKSLSSDHYLISYDVCVSTTPTRPVVGSSSFCYSQADFIGLDSHLLDVDFSPISSLEDVDASCEHLKSTLMEGCISFIPVIPIPSFPSPPWFHAEIRHCFRKIHSVRRLIRKNPTLHRIVKLRSLESAAEEMISSAKESHIANLVSSFSSDPKKLFRYLRDLNRPSTSNVFVNNDGESVKDTACIATCFNEFFHSTFTRSDYILPSIDQLPTPSNQLSSISIDATDTFKALVSLDPNKAMGCDRISPKVIRACATSLCEPVTALFNKCLATSSLPVEWKVHQITPIPKGGDLSQIKNYRPISLLCILSKVLESMVFTQIIDFLRPLIKRNQFGFLTKRSSITQLLACYADIMTSVDNKTPTDVLYLDLRKAFDSVPHQELLFKLWRIGITGPLWYWFKGYLSNRLHCVKYQGATSSHLSVVSGVPQGSVLGPLLFLIYINDIPDVISSCKIFLFADDAKLVKPITCSNDSLHLQNDLDALNGWSEQWKIFLNALKCALLHFSLKKQDSPVTYEVNESTIKCCTTYRDLGILVNSTLSWSDHIDKICSKAYRSFFVIKRNIPGSCKSSLKKRLYLSLVRSHLSYGSQLWRPLLAKDIRNLEKVQRRASKYILNDYVSDYKTRLINLNLLPIATWLELQDLLFLVKCLLDPPDNFDIMDFISFSTNRTRSSSKHRLVSKFNRTTTGRHYYFSRITSLWNAVPEINLKSSLLSIKKELSKFLWNHFINKFNPHDTCTFQLCCPCSYCHLRNPHL